jgi:hypothetical protein
MKSHWDNLVYLVLLGLLALSLVLAASKSAGAAWVVLLIPGPEVLG